MRDGWREVKLGDLFSPVNERLGPHTDEPEVFSVTKYDGMVRAADYFGKRIASDKLDTYKVVEPDEWAYSTIHIDEGSIARNKLGVRGVVSPMYTTFRLTSSEAESFYCELLLRSSWMLAEYGDAQQGSINRRKSLPWKVFAALTVPLPPLVEQRHIVDLIAAIDDVDTFMVDAISAADVARPYALEGLLNRLGGYAAVQPLGELGEFVRGRRFVKSDYVNEGLGCIHYGHIHTHLGSVTTEPLTYIPETLRPRMRLAEPGDVVIAATSEDVNDLAKATVWMGPGEVAVHDDCQIFRHGMDPHYATHVLASASFQQQKVQFAAGTKVMRISGTDLARIRVPVPSRERQEVIGRTMSDFDSTRQAMLTQRVRLGALRSNLLAALLSGDHEIPASYDHLTTWTEAA